MGTPQIILLVLMGIKLLLNAHMHGKPHETENFNFFIAFGNAGILVWILIAGGFFK